MNSLILISPDRGEAFNQFFLVNVNILAVEDLNQSSLAALRDRKAHTIIVS